MSTPNIEWGTNGVTINGTTINSGSLTVSGDLTAQSNINVGSTTLNSSGITIGSSSDPTFELKNTGDITATSIIIGENGTTLSANGNGTIAGNLDVTGYININSEKIKLNSDGTSSFTGKMTITNNNDSETGIFVVGSSSNEASITNKGNASFNNSVSAQTIHAMSSLRLINTSVNSITTGSSALPESPDTSIPTVGYLSKVVDSQSATEPIEIVDTTDYEPDEGSLTLYTYEIRMWIKNAETPKQSSYFGKQYTFNITNSKLSENPIYVTGQQYPWTN